MRLSRSRDGFVWNSSPVMSFLVNLIFAILGVKNDLTNESPEISPHKHFSAKKLIHFTAVKSARCRNHSLVENTVCQ